jgi:hypothetical protein
MRWRGLNMGDRAEQDGGVAMKAASPGWKANRRASRVEFARESWDIFPACAPG